MSYLAWFILHLLDVQVFFNGSVFLVSLDSFGPWETGH